MTNNNPYQAYADAEILSDNALRLVVALYEGAVDAARSARLCLESGDIWGRTKAVNKGISILTELLVTLNHEKGGEIAANLKQLYSYMQRRLLQAHAQKASAPLREVEALLQTMLEGWQKAAAGPVTTAFVESAPERKSEPDMMTPVCQGYWNDVSETQAIHAYSLEAL